ncbi:uncharacterized protein LOC117119824 isoform X2 [Anneissia japonica]|uniref:uncharacterized protein LOC117119824 isoform X2 n=1 Tax=Anneissia japonica TaxID=1529436 RepID=UPI0014256401|nr:uncharacterized protein LOC117119824 isoform X2 [Anneissia japonica]
MQGDWWMEDSTNGRFVKESRNFHSQSQDPWFSRPSSPPSGPVTMPTVVTLTVQPLEPVSENSKIARGSMPMGFGLGARSSASTKRRKKASKNAEPERIRPASSQDAKSTHLRSSSKPPQNDLDWTCFLEKHLPFSSANSPYSHQEIPTTATPLTSSSQVDAVRAISDDLQNLERKLERERDRRTNTESLGVAKFETKISRLKLLRPVAPPESPIEKATSCLSYTGNKECTVLGDDMNNSEVHKRNGFRPSARGTFFTRDHHPSTNPTLTNLNNDNLLAMGALAISTPPSASSRKQQQISKDIRISQTKSKGTMTLPLGRERTKQPKYVYTDAVSGATPAFQQRISEIASLENETLRYERTRKLKKKTKQERD